ncbi:bifunctional [glutamine synthetase] adenylyltransferase/[glutamine synthetase]-adenylyl-L-tyrosine phosphorylase [Nesterenkonia halotolerans]|uniref:Glutamate-ammonia-ligase adenylyltransferase n=1 Tax=Nesterenkonia halotolerans TaxID=225325 RepID=A0ABR9J461_9MICC|nr:bifunctional [glutamine synthetase] adenylyltransferase/[glutamine synthetase]-adenylyl-L-tyrosine phosphorylase [Nesterenkonia halotolerans]MBE1513659.1 glutamate-ammonia-ligase adenylyltransferase [Nesterenkonia halotolerans]
MASSTLTHRDLIAAGFQELERASGFLADEHLSGLDAAVLVRTLHYAPNPDQALLLLIRLVERAGDVCDLFTDDTDGVYLRAVPLIRLLGASEALGEFLVRRPENCDLVFEIADTLEADRDERQHHHTPDDAAALADPAVTEPEVLRARLLESVHAYPAAETPSAELTEEFTAKEAGVALRRAYRRELTALALADLSAADPAAYQPLVSRQLADLAAAAIDAALAVSRAELTVRNGRTAATVELAVIGMGKCGARELNYISDVDVIFVHRAAEDIDSAAARNTAVAMASGISKVINGSGPEPGLWEVDANLRPEGREGDLSRTLESHLEYYKRWAHGWEFQALLKARPIAGSRSLGQDYIEAIWPQVWTSSAQENFVENVQRMRRRVFDNIPADEVDREIKLGRGGLRDIEFTVQLLQLVHGRVDESLRVRDSLTAIEMLEAGEYVARSDRDAMSRCYRMLRLFEHRIQMSHMRRTHLMPVKSDEIRALAHAVRPPNRRRRPAGDEVLNQWRDIAREVASFHERIFYRPLLSTTAVLSDDEVRLTAKAAQDRLSALGYHDAAGAMRHISALTSGLTRRAKLQRRILPMMLGWFGEGVDPDGGLLAFRRLSESLGQSPWYLTMLRDSSVAAERLSLILAGSKFISDMLEHSPESTKWLGDNAALAPRSFETLWREVSNKITRHKGDLETGMRLTRLVRKRETLRVAIADAVGLLDVSAVGTALSDVDRAATLGALRVAEREIWDAEGRHADLAVIAMGRQGGREIGYSSDMDALFVHTVAEGGDASLADVQAQKLAARVSALLSKPLKPAIRGEFPLKLDADLRPEGKNGPLSRSLDSYGEYYRRWMDVWERQALLRARPIAGDDRLLAEFMEMADAVRYGSAPSASQIREIRRIKARVESERLPRGADPSRHVKLGRGGLSDVEWLVQLLQLEHAHAKPRLRTTSTLTALDVLVDEELLSPSEAEQLTEAWTLCTRVRSASTVWSGKTSDVLPSARRDLDAVARWCGFEAGGSAEFEEHYLRTTRRCRQVYERLFYDEA